MARDQDLALRVAGDGNLTADETNLTILDLGPGGTGAHGVEVWFRLPQDSGTDTLVVTVNHDDDSAMGSVDETETFPTVTGGTDTFPYLASRRVVSNRRYLALIWNVTDTGGGVNFGAATAGVKFGSLYERGTRP